MLRKVVASVNDSFLDYCKFALVFFAFLLIALGGLYLCEELLEEYNFSQWEQMSVAG